MEYLDKFIEACNACSVANEKCATALLFEDNVREMRNCILLNRECSAMCLATARILSVGVDRFPMLFRACEEMCMVCARECGLHADIVECKKCAEACRHCVDMCRRLKPELVN